MRIAYLDCASGISGDMLLGAAVDAGVPMNAIVGKVASLGPTSATLEAESVRRQGFRGTKVHVNCAPEHAHRHLQDILRMIAGSELNSAEQELSERVFRKLAEAEARVHGLPIDKVHFHEVGAVDSIVDIVGGCVAWLHLNIERAFASAVPVGGGFIEIAHGRCRVPARATAELMKGIPIAESPCEAELTTPTGAALLACLVHEFGPLPSMRVTSIGYGAGDHDFSTHANLLRLWVGDASDGELNTVPETDEVSCLETNLDDTTGESIAHCSELLLAAGALDVFATPIIMKKGRPAIQLSVLCSPAQQPDLQSLLFSETNTIGIRYHKCRRAKLPREEVAVSTAFGDIRGKVVQLPDGAIRFSAEFESCRQAAAHYQVTLQQVVQAAEHGFARKP